MDKFGTCADEVHVEVSVDYDPSIQAHLAALPLSARRTSDEARDGIAKERQMSFVTGCQLYPKAVFWSAILSSTIVMEAYDKILMGSLYASPAFQRRFGTVVALTAAGKTDHQLSPMWQAGLTNAAVGTEIVGLFLNGLLTERLGFRKTMVVALAFMCLAITVSVFAVSLEMLLVSQLLCGTSRAPTHPSPRSGH
jgi:MFS transporter, SP family, general alpha glucoside:H+ symporter